MDTVFIRLAHERFLLEYVHTIRQQIPGMGGEKLWLLYKEYFGSEHSLGRDAFLDVLRENGLMLRKRKRSCRTTDSTHGLPLYPDLVKDLLLHRARQVWVSDITYIWTDEGFCFLSLVSDAYSHEILGWFVGPTLEAIYTLEALKMACRSFDGDKKEELIHHSDRGIQYASLLYTSFLKEEKIRISMTQSGDPKDNAIAERINGILKNEFLNHYQFKNIAQVRQKMEQVVRFYNTQRPHRSLDMMTPRQAREKTGAIRKRWKCYKDEYRESASSEKAIFVLGKNALIQKSRDKKRPKAQTEGLSCSNIIVPVDKSQPTLGLRKRRVNRF